MNTKKNKNTDSPHFREFFLDQIKDVYWAEKHLSSGLKKMRKAATSPKLAAAFEKHIEETAGQIERLKRVFELLGKTPQAKKCEAMEGLVSEAESMIEDTRKTPIRGMRALFWPPRKPNITRSPRTAR